MKILTKTLWSLVYALPAVLFFSYYPVISLGGNSSMNFELSLPLIWLIVFDILAFVKLLSLGRAAAKKSHLTIHLPGLSDRRFFLLSLFPLYLTLSVFWSANPLRGLLTAGVMWLVFCAVFAILYILPLSHPSANLRRNVLYSLLISGVVISVFCFIQSILDTAGLSRENTLMCAGCTYRSFGFPHPSGFAIEPQFMGNLLLAPTLTALYLLIFANPAPKSATSTSRIWLTLATLILSTTLFFTFSRGAIYAYAVALVVLLIFALRRHLFRWSLIILPVASFVISLILQGTFAALGPTPETFTSGITKSIHQLSLGLIDLRGNQADSSNLTTSNLNPVENSAQLVENNQENVDNSHTNCAKDVDNSDKNVENSTENCVKPVQNPPQTEQNSVDNPAQNSTHFSGYVAESTNIRLSLSNTAVKTWLNAPGRSQISFGSDCNQPYGELCTSFTPSSILFGVGLGGAGTAMHIQYPDIVTSPKEIVQHQGFSLLLETGFIGILLLIFEFLICFWPSLFSAKFLDGRAATLTHTTSSAAKTTSTSIKLTSPSKTSELAKSLTPAGISPFWQHPALPLLLALVVAYLITLNFFAGLPNALQIYLMPPLLYLIFQPIKSLKNS